MNSSQWYTAMNFEKKDKMLMLLPLFFQHLLRARHSTCINLFHSYNRSMQLLSSSTCQRKESEAKEIKAFFPKERVGWKEG